MNNQNSSSLSIIIIEKDLLFLNINSLVICDGKFKNRYFLILFCSSIFFSVHFVSIILNFNDNQLFRQ